MNKYIRVPQVLFYPWVIAFLILLYIHGLDIQSYSEANEVLLEHGTWELQANHFIYIPDGNVITEGELRALQTLTRTYNISIVRRPYTN